MVGDNKLESIELLPKVNLPKIEEKDEKTLRQLQLEISNISEKNKKISKINNWKRIRTHRYLAVANTIKNGVQSLMHQRLFQQRAVRNMEAELLRK